MGNYVIKKNGYLVPYIGAELEDIVVVKLFCNTTT